MVAASAPTPLPIDPRTLRLERKRGVEAEPMEEELLLYEARAERVTSLNGSAALIWHLCDGSRTVSDIIELLEGAYPNEAGVAEQTLELTRLLVAEGMLVPAVSATTSTPDTAP